MADEWVTQMLRQGDAKVFKKYSQMKREALEKVNGKANEARSFDTGLIRFEAENDMQHGWQIENWFRIKAGSDVGA